MNNSTISEKKKEANAKAGIGWGGAMEQELLQMQKDYNLEQLAEEHKALIRHRGVQSAMDLLRIVMGYSVLDYSLRMLGIWCSVLGIAHLSKTALLKRLRQSQQWMGRLVMLALEQQQLLLPNQKRLRVRLIDGSVICQRGSRGTDWRLHMSFDLLAGCLDAIELTDGHGAERLQRFEFKAGELCIADRAYALAKSLGWIVSKGAWVLVRVGWNRVKFQYEDGRTFDVVQWLREARLSPLGTPAELTVWIQCPEGRYPFRLLAQAISEEAAEKARCRARAESKKNHHTPDERSLFMAGFVLLLTNLPLIDWSMERVLQLYRFRWQIELAFKRMKGLIHLDHLRCKDPDLVQVCLLGKLLAFILMERQQLAFAAQRMDAFLASDRPISFWGLNAFLLDDLRSSIRGHISWDQIQQAFPRLLRYLADEPRKRIQQLAAARTLFFPLTACPTP
jgi:hypothetical protein